MRGRVVASAVVVGALVTLVPSSAYACPVCFGGAEGPMAEAVNNGIMLMLGVVAAVQFGFVALFVSIWKRGRALDQDQKLSKEINGDVS